MGNIVHISEATNIALHSMILLAGDPERALRAREVAELLGVSEDHLAKVLHRLGKAGLVSATRGPSGGFKLTRSPSKIRLLEIFEVIEGPLSPKVCLLGKPRCSGECVLGDFVSSTTKSFEEKLARTRLSEVAGGLRISQDTET